MSIPLIRLIARYIVPVDGPVIEGGAIDVAEGRIVAVGDGSVEGAVDFGHAAILPGLINVHTHLEFSLLPAPLSPPRPFADWIASVVNYRRSRTEAPAEAVAAGLSQSAAAGVTTVGEIATHGWSPRPFHADAPRGVLFRELLGLADDAIESQMAIAREHLAASADDGAASILRGLSPHAPYSVHPELYRRVMTLAAERRVPVAVHLAETREELELLDAGTGPLVERLRAFEAWNDGLIPCGTRPLDYLHPLSAAPQGLIVHGNYLARDEIDFLARNPQLSVVYCPRTHAYFGHAEHPWRQMMDRGVRVVLGTDSRASNPDLNLWSEMRFLRRRFPDVSSQALLRMTTLDAAASIGRDRDTGSLTPGKAADLTIVALPGSHHDLEGKPCDQVLSARRILATMRSGRWIFGSEPGGSSLS